MTTTANAAIFATIYKALGSEEQAMRFIGWVEKRPGETDRESISPAELGDLIARFRGEQEFDMAHHNIASSLGAPYPSLAAALRSASGDSEIARVADLCELAANSHTEEPENRIRYRLIGDACASLAMAARTTDAVVRLGWAGAARLAIAAALSAALATAAKLEAQSANTTF